MRRVRFFATALCAVLGLLALACANLAGGGDVPSVEELAGEGDPQRRASLRLVADGLEADARGDSRRAQSRYERALQIDSGNPYAYLALARHYVEQEDPERALAYIDRAQVLFESHDLLTPGVETHLLGLRGAALTLSGSEREGDALLDEAAWRAPEIWRDRALSAEELR